MIIYHNIAADIKIAELSDEKLKIREPQDILDIIADIGLHDCRRLAVYQGNLHDDFFNLKTRLAGEILQKFSNYRVKLAVIGDFSSFRSKSLQDFIRESNRRNLVSFVPTIEDALLKLGI